MRMNEGSGPSVASLGEAEVLRRVLAHLGDAQAAVVGPGDDCAVIRSAGDIVVTSDMMIEGPDFRAPWHTGFELGRKLVATNFSDVAAMGARPTGLTLALGCPDETPIDVLEDIARGLTAACEELAPGSGVIGGDLSRSPRLTAAITAFGDLESRQPVLRSGARVGDRVAYSGDLGLAGIGLSLLFARSADADGIAHAEGVAMIRAEHPAALASQLAPRPPIALGVAAANAGATAMLDVSDGLSIDAARISRASGVVIDLDARALERCFGTQRGEQVSLEAMLYGGEDHGLLATFPSDAVLPDGFWAIGEVREAAAGAAVAGDPAGGSAGGSAAGAAAELLLSGEPCRVAGWDPFTVRPPGS